MKAYIIKHLADDMYLADNGKIYEIEYLQDDIKHIFFKYWINDRTIFYDDMRYSVTCKSLAKYKRRLNIKEITPYLRYII
jgi:hypothetical protein